MGHRQAALFYEFSLERHIPADHLLQSIDRFVFRYGVLLCEHFNRNSSVSDQRRNGFDDFLIFSCSRTESPCSEANNFLT